MRSRLLALFGLLSLQACPAEAVRPDLASARPAPAPAPSPVERPSFETATFALG